MLFLLSPAKMLDEHTPPPITSLEQPELLQESEALIDILRQYSTEEIQSLMKVSERIAEQNVERFREFEVPFTSQNAKPALYLFNGDVYQGLSAYDLPENCVNFLNRHLAILSGLYGIIRPLDLIAPYRLEMGTALPNPRGKNLYEFWGDLVTEYLNRRIDEIDAKVVINLASNEYFKAIRPEKLKARVVTPVFKDFSNGEYKVIGVYAKKARGLMTRFVSENNITDLQELKKFNLEGYAYKPNDVTGEIVFIRG